MATGFHGHHDFLFSYPPLSQEMQLWVENLFYNSVSSFGVIIERVLVSKR